MPVTNPRIKVRNDREIVAGEYVLYWMQQSQRAEHNPALDIAIQEANRLHLPVIVGFGLTDAYPEANLRHYRFMLEGLVDVKDRLIKMGIQLVVRMGSPDRVALELGQQAALMVCDVGYTRYQRQWRWRVAKQAPCLVVQVEGDVVVPVAVASAKAEYAARTFRPRVKKHIHDFLRLSRPVKPQQPSLGMEIHGLDLNDIDTVLSKLDLDRSVEPVTGLFKGGTSEANRRLKNFLGQHLDHYDANRNQPQTDDISHMSPYLHFGQISPVRLALAVRDAKSGQASDRDGYLEELIVRRELAVNFVYYEKEYDRYTCLPAWAQKTLAEHAGDPREYKYSQDVLEAAQTHDPYWNAAMREMKHTGFMHNYMRMYWGKKILEWSGSPEQAFATTLSINNKYFLDGRDPNSYAGVAWVFGKHDRAWFERPIFGKVRYMAASGLERKCDIKAYVEKVDGRVRGLKS
ncbi:Phr: DNA photolyase (deoxyribodipyrimidine photo-lyase) [Desulfosarcina variabilis str. Montpellier]|uniref:deoxyribodipyrimidine photo-lyase n=1 Tax=Desulfosarcina variabilis TaxID=2300 RepID=UPI003AFAE988